MVRATSMANRPIRNSAFLIRFLQVMEMECVPAGNGSTSQSNMTNRYRDEPLIRNDPYSCI